MFEQFLQINFHAKTKVVIAQANSIIDEYAAQGFSLTVRQLYYQFVARNWLKNTFQNYQRLASIVDDARKCGLIDWNSIVDRTRFLRRIPTYGNPKSFLHSAIGNYAEDVWRSQEYYAEVWIEKDALIGVAEKACNDLRVPYFACRGYPSSSELYKAAQRLRRKRDQGKWPIVFYLGDHDPSGQHMGLVNAPELVEMFGRSHDIEFRMIALTRDQIDEYNPPENYAKESDARFNWYVETTGLETCWELDALEPSVIDALIRDNIENILDRPEFEAKLAEEAGNQSQLYAVKDEFDKIAPNLAMIRRFLAHRTPEMESYLLRQRMDE